MDKEKVIILTGSFNPPTKAHLRALVEAMDKTGAVKGYFVPVSHEYVQRKMLKKGDNIVIPDEKKMEMLISMAREDSRIEISDFEISGRGDSVYTYNTICEIQRLNPDKDVCYLAGADKLKGLSKWHNKEEFLQNYKVIVFDREEFDSKGLIEKDELLSKYKDSFIVLDKISDDADISDISATKIRNLFRQGNEEYRKYLTDGAASIMASMSPSDFPEVTFEDWVKIMKTSPNRHTNQVIFKKVYEENKKIIASIDDLKDRIASTKVYNSKIPLNRSFEDIIAAMEDDGSVVNRCMNADIVDVAKTFKKRGYYPAIICSSCGSDAAGFYASGDMMSKLTENDLCRRSTLSSNLYQFGNPRRKAVKESGVELKGNMYPLDEKFGVVYSPDVLFFREGFKKNFALMDEPFSCSVVSFVPLDFAKKNSPDLKYRLDEDHFTDEGRQVMKEKIRMALHVAAENGHDCLIIDDCGMRSGKLPPYEIGSLFNSELYNTEFLGRFPIVIFALEERKRNSSNEYFAKSKYGWFHFYFDMAELF